MLNHLDKGRGLDPGSNHEAFFSFLSAWIRHVSNHEVFFLADQDKESQDKESICKSYMSTQGNLASGDV